MCVCVCVFVCVFVCVWVVQHFDSNKCMCGENINFPIKWSKLSIENEQEYSIVKHLGTFGHLEGK